MAPFRFAFIDRFVRHNVAFGASVLVLLLVPPGLSFWLSERSNAGPKLQLPSAPLHLGNGRPNEVKTGELELKNVGSSALEFRISASCGCMELDPGEGMIAAGNVQRVRVGVKLPSYFNSGRSVQLRVSTNERDSAPREYLVLAECPGPVNVLPMGVNFGTLRENEVSTASVNLRVTTSEGLSKLDPEQMRLRWNSEWLLVTRHRDDPRELQLRASLLEGLPEGDLYDTIEIDVVGSGGVIGVPVYARVVPSVYIAPSTVFLRVNPATGRFDEAHVLVWTTDDRTALGALLAVSAPEGITVSDGVEGNEARRRLRIGVASEPVWGPDGQVEIRVKFEGIDDSVPIKLTKPSKERST